MSGRIDWYYHRNGCNTCTRAQNYLVENAFEIAETVNAKAKLGREAALELARQASRLVATRGVKEVELDLAAAPKEEEILGLVIGPTGNLRAPLMRVGDTLFVGFPKEGFADLRKHS